eukprot:TRINITY_DN18270_c0_g6_i1.p1 TRINITY_DN18270_c0_g6~~TRINITY_DN18270_c0_g6_i1.p1  ORF type:complete len:508 (+),score=79.27 TRINITY_DN18270_c0_g6_i1:84-1526(+)
MVNGMKLLMLASASFVASPVRASKMDFKEAALAADDAGFDAESFSLKLLQVAGEASNRKQSSDGASSVVLASEKVDCFDEPGVGNEDALQQKHSEALKAKTAALTLMTSSGLGSWASDGISITPSEGMLQAFRELVLQLPDGAWESDGSKRKDDARGKDVSKIKQESFHEPELYDGLKVVILEDSCFLKKSFWDRKNEHFNISSGISLNYLEAGYKTAASLVQPYLDTGSGLDGGWCVNFAADRPAFLGGLGFRADFVQHLSIFDELATDDMKKAIFDLVVAGKTKSLSTLSQSHSKILHESGKLNHVVDKLKSADIIIANGGNPDFSKYVFIDFAGEVLKPVLEKVHAGSVIYMGQSAGSMVGSADMGLTFEPSPAIFEDLLREDTRGLSLIGRCAIRPHDPQQSKKYDIISAVYGKLKGVKVIRLHNGDGLKCIRGYCQAVGNTRLPTSVFHGPDDPHLIRLVEALKPTETGNISQQT